jgi:VWFA-related protein
MQYCAFRPVPAYFRRVGAAITISLVCFACAATLPNSIPLSQSAPAEKEACVKAEAVPADLAKRPNYRQVIFSARSNLPRELTVGDLNLYQANNHLAIEFFEPQPVTVGILVDNSGSMQPKLPQAKSALTAFIRNLNSSDEIFVATFSDRPQVLSPVTIVHQVAIDHLDSMHAFGRTALYDVILQGLHTASQGCYKRKALLVITDGIDTASLASMGQTMDEARKLKIPIYSIGIGETRALSGSSSLLSPSYISCTGSPVGCTSGAGEVDTRTLTALAKDTGGESYLVALDDKGERLKRATTAIAGEIGNEYMVGFISDSLSNKLLLESPRYKELAFKLESAEP